MVKKIAIYSTTVIIILLFCNCTRKPHKITPYVDIDDTTVLLAEEMYFELFKSCEEGDSILFMQNEHISPKLKRLIRTGKTCIIIKEELGEITGIELVEAVHFKSVIRILRYKISCTKINAPIEFRIFLTTDNSLSDFNFYEWNDLYDYSIPAKKWLNSNKYD